MNPKLPTTEQNKLLLTTGPFNIQALVTFYAPTVIVLWGLVLGLVNHPDTHL